MDGLPLGIIEGASPKGRFAEFVETSRGESSQDGCRWPSRSPKVSVGRRSRAKARSRILQAGQRGAGDLAVPDEEEEGFGGQITLSRSEQSGGGHPQALMSEHGTGFEVAVMSSSGTAGSSRKLISLQPGDLGFGEVFLLAMEPWFDGRRLGGRMEV